MLVHVLSLILKYLFVFFLASITVFGVMLVFHLEVRKWSGWFVTIISVLLVTAFAYSEQIVRPTKNKLRHNLFVKEYDYLKRKPRPSLEISIAELYKEEIAELTDILYEVLDSACSIQLTDVEIKELATLLAPSYYGEIELAVSYRLFRMGIDEDYYISE